ncbi:hypothetical protein, partial [Sinisalibacter aestuarii]|uniref:hypothetical protein n=1 Tax=Sinisalibacter aestuarii TaxID=2949426 RepID=UPI002492CF2F
SGFPVFRFSGFPVFRFSGFPVFRFSGFPVFRFSGFPVFRFSGENGANPMFVNTFYCAAGYPQRLPKPE